MAISQTKLIISIKIFAINVTMETAATQQEVVMTLYLPETKRKEY
jgi:hypothetical protein